MQWYYSKNSTQLGPVEQHELLAKIAAGEVTAADLVWREGMPDWVPCGQAQELRGQAMPAAYGQVPPADDPASPYAPPAMVGQGAVPYAPPVPSNGKATASLVLGIISTVFALCGCYGTVIAIPCGILAVVFGNQVKQAASIDPSLLGEMGKVKAGVITGWIGIGLSALFTLGILAFFGLMGHMK